MEGCDRDELVDDEAGRGVGGFGPAPVSHLLCPRSVNRIHRLVQGLTRNLPGSLCRSREDRFLLKVSDSDEPHQGMQTAVAL